MAFELLTKIADEAEKVITQLATQPVNVLTTGVLMIAVPMMMIWILYKGYMIMGGFQEAYIPAFIKDYAIKFVLLLVAGTSGFYLSNVQNLMKDTPAVMVKDLTGESKVTNIVESKLEVALKNLDKATSESANAPPDNYSDSYLGDLHRRWDELISKIPVISELADFWDIFIIVLKLMIIIGGLLYLAIVLTKIILINKTFFMLGLGFGPLFIMFAAFEKTRGWFNSWLNTTIGYGMSYVVIMFAAKILMSILDILWKGDVSFLDAFSSLFVCIALAIVISRVGDIASAWFSAGNIADGTAAAAAVAFGGMGARIKGAAQTVGGNAKEATVRGYGAWRNRGQAKMNRYNTRRTYEKNKKEEAAEKKQNSSTSIGKGN